MYTNNIVEENININNDIKDNNTNIKRTIKSQAPVKDEKDNLNLHYSKTAIGKTGLKYIKIN